MYIRILNATGHKAEAKALLDEMIESAGQRYVSPYHLAMAYMGLGDEDQALVWLEKAVVENNPMLTFLRVENLWDDLRDQPEFESILQRVNLADIAN
jgi:tetratricopeptide (TPR) repeat protein